MTGLELLAIQCGATLRRPTISLAAAGVKGQRSRLTAKKTLKTRHITVRESIFTILADTGFRIGEVQFLTWKDVDCENNLLHVRAKEGWKPKDGDQRSVPMSSRVRAMLEQLPRGSQWVVTAPASEKYPTGDHKNLDRRALRTLKRVLRRLGLNGKIHTFRHAFLSRALIRGTPEALVRAWAGHVDWNILKLYRHIANSDSQAAMQRLSKVEDQTLV